jgi:hypothetical protein
VKRGEGDAGFTMQNLTLAHVSAWSCVQAGPCTSPWVPPQRCHCSLWARRRDWTRSSCSRASPASHPSPLRASTRWEQGCVAEVLHSCPPLLLVWDSRFMPPCFSLCLGTEWDAPQSLFIPT